ncbi:hypothetical protein [Actinophytocola glycyrrhizae]|uniref:ABC-type branched-subunit amino acid transport system substrate-binding protein n=1 Tax=Actinophytocola glycyrrhizae TaxID=2044873 RepID=A0ABV9SD14_9PSEU
MSESDAIVPPETAMVRKRRRRTRMALITVAVVLVTAGVWGAVTVFRTCGSLGSGVQEIDGDCVGVTDGTYAFHPDLADIQARIAAENARVREHPNGYVSVALLDPLTPTGHSALPPSAVRNRLEGAYTALRRINRYRVAGDPNPQIQLLLANQGSSDDQWRHVLTRLRELSEAEPPLLGVIGLGVSTARTKQQAEDLSGLGIPMVAAVLTADDFEYDHIPGLIKTSPSNRHYVAALRDYLGSTALDSAIMVRDSNSDLGSDLYTRTLEEQFATQMGDYIKFETQQFTGVSGSGDEPPSLFDNVQANICAAADEEGVAILYAGREIDLGDLLESLENRTCTNAPLTVLTAGLELGEVLKDIDLRAAKLTILNAATVDPAGWNRGEEGTPTYYEDFRLAYVNEERFSPRHLRDGGAIMMHDALLTAARAIRLAAPEGSASQLTPKIVRTQLLNINTGYEVRGASGTLRFSKLPARGGTGIPKGKPIPVIQYPHPTDEELPSQRVGRLCVITTGPGILRCGA